MLRLHNSLYHLDQAKYRWAEEKHKSEQDAPTLEDLAPYLGKWTNSIGQLVSLGITFKPTPLSEMEPQSDMATLTRDLHFRRGICRYYPAGSRFSLQTRWDVPELSKTSRFKLLYFNHREQLAAALFVLAIAAFLVFAIVKIRTPKQSA